MLPASILFLLLAGSPWLPGSPQIGMSFAPYTRLSYTSLFPAEDRGGRAYAFRDATFRSYFGTLHAAGRMPLMHVAWFPAGRGRYAVDGENVSFQAAEWEASTNVGPFEEVIVELAKGLARALAPAAGISEEEYPAFEEEIVADFLAEAATKSSIEEWLAPGGVYDAEAKVLSLGDVEFTRAATAVQKASWGQIKEGM